MPSHALAAISRVVALALLITLAGTSQADRFTPHLDGVEDYLNSQRADAQAGLPTVLPVDKLERLIRRLEDKNTKSHKQELELLEKVGTKLLGRKAVFGTGDPGAENVLSNALANLTIDIALRARLAESSAQDLEGRVNGARNAKRRKQAERNAAKARALAAADAPQNARFKQLVKRILDVERLTSNAERKILKLIRKLGNCPGRVFSGAESADVILDGGLPIVFDTFQVHHFEGSNEWQFNLYRCEPYFELLFILRVPEGGRPIGSSIFFPPPGVDPGDHHLVAFREDPANDFVIGFTGAIDPGDFDPDARSITLGFFASNGISTLAGGSLVLTDWND